MDVFIYSSGGLKKDIQVNYLNSHSLSSFVPTKKKQRIIISSLTVHSNLLLLIYILTLSFIFSTHSYNNKCLHHQEILLLQLKDELIFNSSRSTKLATVWNVMLLATSLVCSPMMRVFLVELGIRRVSSNLNIWRSLTSPSITSMSILSFLFLFIFLFQEVFRI